MTRNRAIFWSLIIILALGLMYRYIGIQKELSYWNDESHVALMSRGILHYGQPLTAIGAGNGFYQIGFYYLTALSFTLFGENEIAGRIPSIFAGTLLILAIYFLTRKLLGEKQAIIVGLITAFSQIQLAWSTQLRPYIWLELFMLGVTYCCIKYYKNGKNIVDINLLFATLLAILAFSFHLSGIFNFVLIGGVVIAKSIQKRKFLFIFSLIPFALIGFFALLYSFDNALGLLLKVDTRIYHYFRFLSVNYWWLGIGAIIGSYSLWHRDKRLFYILTSFIVIIFLIALKINTQYVRYSVPAFPLLYILYAEGLTFVFIQINERIKNSRAKITYMFLILLFFIAIPIFQQKIIIWPKYYYSINADIRENPIVDYKSAFKRIEKIITEKKLDQSKLVIMDAWNDRVPYYLPGKKFIFLNRYATEPLIDPHYGEKMISKIGQYEEEKKKYEYGLVIVENWPSITSPELQDHIRRTLKHEFDVNNLPYNEDDKWSISVYSWGL